MSICQGLPCSIDEDYSCLLRPKLDDFPRLRSLQAQISLHSIELATIVGYINKQLIISRRTGSDLPSTDIAPKLVGWISSLPPLLQLSVCASYDGTFDWDVHLLHLPFLNAITLVYLYTSDEQLPQASVASILAAGCTARIVEDLIRKDVMILLPEEAGWYAATAALALMHVRPLETLAMHAAQHIDVLQAFLERMGKTWKSSRALLTSLRRALAKTPPATTTTPSTASAERKPAVRPASLEDLCAGDGVPWPDFFPFATLHTSPLVKTILVECQSTFPQLWLATVPGGFDAFLDELNAEPHAI